MSALVDIVRQATLPTPDEEWTLRGTAPASLLRTAAAAFTPEPGELEHVLREAPRGPGGRRWGEVPEPLAVRASGRRGGLLATAAVGVGLATVGGMAEAAGAIDALRALVLPGGGLDALPAVPEASASCPMPDLSVEEAVARADGARPGGGGAGPSSDGTPALVDASAEALTLLQARNPHPNPRLVRVVGGAAAPVARGAATGEAPAAAGVAGQSSPPAAGTPPSRALPTPGGGGSPTPAAEAVVPLSPGAPTAYAATAPAPVPLVEAAVVHTVTAVARDLPVDLTEHLSSCPVWPGEPGLPVFTRAAPPPPLQPAVVAIAPPMAAPALPAPRAPSPPRASGAVAAPVAPRAAPAPAAPVAPDAPTSRTPSGLSRPDAAVGPSTLPPSLGAPEAPAAPTARPSPTATEALRAVIWGDNLGDGPPPLPECEPAGADEE